MICTDEAYPDEAVCVFLISLILIQPWVVIAANTLFKKVVFLYVTTLRIKVYGNTSYTN